MGIKREKNFEQKKGGRSDRFGKSGERSYPREKNGKETPGSVMYMDMKNDEQRAG